MGRSIPLWRNSHDRHSRREKDTWCLQDSHPPRTISLGRNIGHGHHRTLNISRCPFCNIKRTSDRCVDFKNVWFAPQYIRAGSDNEQGLFFGESSFSIKVVLEKIDIGFGWIIGIKEFLVRRSKESRCLNIYFCKVSKLSGCRGKDTFADAFLCRYLGAVFHYMYGEIDVCDWSLVLNCINGLAGVLIRSIRNRRGRGRGG